jgi:hypothetical protein
MNREQIEQAVEALCLKGCTRVRADIKLLQRGLILPELQDLDELARRTVLKELQSIMAVYGEACPAERKIGIGNKSS